jgi:hypothetical protein
MTPKNGRAVRLTGDLTNCTTKIDSDGKIEELICSYDDCDFIIKIGDTIRPTPKSPHKVNHIVSGYHNDTLVCYDLLNCNINNTSIFALPFLGGNRRLFMWDKLFINAFIETSDHKDCIALLYRYSGDVLFLKFESALCSFKTFRCKYDPDPYHVMFVFDVPKKCKQSFKHYINGKYSQIDDLWKLKILEFHGFDIDGHTGRILFQSDSLRRKMEKDLDVILPPNSELHSKPDERKEIFDLEYYSIKTNKLTE